MNFVNACFHETTPKLEHSKPIGSNSVCYVGTFDRHMGTESDTSILITANSYYKFQPWQPKQEQNFLKLSVFPWKKKNNNNNNKAVSILG